MQKIESTGHEQSELRNTKKMAFNVVVEDFIEDLLSLECLSYIQIKIPTIE